ncbi:MAG: DNA repair protein RadC [Candidatus Cryptobacteroides sp.]
MKMKDWCKAERPREKMYAKGAGALGDSELLAVLLRSGTRDVNVFDLAGILLSRAGGSLTRLSGMSVRELCRIKGIGKSKALTVIAAMELGKRMCAEAPDRQSRTIRDPGDVYREFLPQFRGLKHEECHILYLSRSNRVIAKEMLSSGGLSETTVDIRMIVKAALEMSASGVIMAHNHPSGNPLPGKADLAVTKSLKAALDTFDIHLVDHIVIADGSYYSFADETICRK